VVPKLSSTATQFLERQSIATNIALLDKKKSSSKKKKIFVFIIEYNSTKTRFIMRRVICALVSGIIYWGRYGVYYVPYFLPSSNFVLFFHFPISCDF
jgi:hypothetical protein